MRRSSGAQLQTQLSEPLIVVEDSNPEEDQDDGPRDPDNFEDSDEESPTIPNPYLLSPYSRDIRKHSLPTPQCSGITASQVRRLSERGETVGPGPRQTEFLATLSTAPAPSPGGRRHSVVTISRVPPAFFGRSRRESVAALSPGGGGHPPTFGRILPNRRESIACPPSTEPRGSVHNLQLDIMDDIVQARKVRMKLWNTSSERVCEVQPLDESAASNVQRYTNSSSGGRRYSDFVGTTLAPIPSTNSKRRASELPPPGPMTTATTTASASKLPAAGIVCSNTDLISILSSLSTSATEINNQCEDTASASSSAFPRTSASAAASAEYRRSCLKKANRSNSFDISILHDDPRAQNWFQKRHQPKSDASAVTVPANTPKVSFAPANRKGTVVEKEPGKVVWDERSGSLVDAHALGSAIEVFLRQSTPETGSSQTSPQGSPNKSGRSPKSTAGRSKTSWFSGKGDSDSTETCDSSLCSTLKDLFVK